MQMTKKKKKINKYNLSYTSMCCSDVLRDALEHAGVPKTNNNTATCIPDQRHKWPEGLDHKTLHILLHSDMH